MHSTKRLIHKILFSSLLVISGATSMHAIPVTPRDFDVYNKPSDITMGKNSSQFVERRTAVKPTEEISQESGCMPCYRRPNYLQRWRSYGY